MHPAWTPRRIATAAALGVAMTLLAPDLARASNLEYGCTTLPLGPDYALAAGWKNLLYDWLDQGQGYQFEWSQGTPQLQSPVEAFGAGYQPNGNNCVVGPGFVSAPPWANLGPQEYLQIEQFWLLNVEYSGLAWTFLNHDPNIYTLGAMEDVSNCEARTPSLAWGNALAFLATWEYPGNPFGPGQPDHDALVARLSAWMSLQLIMLDWAHHDSAGVPLPDATLSGLWNHPPPSSGFGGAANGAELAGQLGMMAWSYGHIRDELPDWMKEAMDEAFEMYAERVWLWNPYHPQSNRGIRSVPALYYVGEATGSPSVQSWYEDFQAQFFDPNMGNWVDSGYWHDDYAFDMGYNGSNMMVAVRAIAEDPAIQPYVYDATATTFDLTAHLALPDVDGWWTSPNVFNSRTAQGPVYLSSASPRSGYYGGVQRFLPAMNEWLPWTHAAMRDMPTVGPQAPNGLDPRDVDFHENLACRSQGYAGSINAAIAASPETSTVDAQGSSVWPHLTRSQDFGLPPVGVETLQLGDLEDWWDDVQAMPELELMPIEVDGPYVRNFSDRFVFAKFGGGGTSTPTATVLHLGETALGSFGESGFGGGQLVSHWSAPTGPTLLGRRKGRNTGSVPSDDQWAEWRTFPFHTVTLEVASGGGRGIVSTARTTNVSPQVFLVDPPPTTGTQIEQALTSVGAWASPTTVPESQATGVVARVHGDIGVHGRSATTSALVSNVLTQPIAYERSFVVQPDGVWVHTEVGASAPAELVEEAWETIPLWGGDLNSTEGPATVRIYSGQTVITTQIGTAAQPGQTGPFPQVTHVEVDRGSGTTTITFTSPQTVQLGDQWALANVRSRTLHVDLMPTTCTAPCALQPRSVTYSIVTQ